MLARAAGRDQRPDHLRPRPRLVAEDDDDRLDRRLDLERGRETDLERAGQMARIGIADALLRQPVDAVLDLLRRVTEDDDDLVDPGRPDGIEDVLEDRPALEEREGLRRPEPARRPRREHDRRDVHLAAPTTASRIGTPLPP